MTVNDGPQVEQLLIELRSLIRSAPNLDFQRSNIHELAKRMTDVVPRTLTKNAMAGKVGPFYEGSGLQTWLGVSKQALHKRREANTILACRTQEAHWVYPVWQFQEDGSLIPGLRDVLQVLATGIKDGWTWALWLTSEVPGQLDGKSVVQWLSEGGDLAPVLQFATVDAASWAA